MKQYIKILALSLLIAGCSSTHKAKKINTDIKNSAEIGGGENVGVKDGKMIVQKKVQMNEELRRIQNEVFSLEDRVYGSRRYQSEGLYGALKKCKAEVVSSRYGGDGKLRWTEPIQRVTENEDEWKIGLNDKKIIGVSTEYLKDRIKRFKGYKKTLMSREDEYQEKLSICDAELASKKHMAK